MAAGMQDEHPLANLDTATANRIFGLWDKMSRTDPIDMDASLKVLLQELCQLLGAYTANSLVAVRMSTRKKSDALMGWRPRHTVHLEMTPQIRANLQDAKRRLDSDTHDVTVLRNIAFAGSWRAKRLCELAPPEWFESEFYQQFAVRVGCRDALWIGCPVNKDLELYVGLFRNPQQPLFQAQDGEVALVAMRGLSWFLQRYVLGLGLNLADAPLTGMERRVLTHLLKGDTQSNIAERMRQSHHTTHDHIKSIYRKFNVNSRAALSALWLGLNAT